MEDLTGNLAPNRDEFLNDTPASAASSTMSIDETETQGVGEIPDSSSETLVKESGSQASDKKASDEITDATSAEQNYPPVEKGNGDSVLTEQVGTVQCKDMNSQDKDVNETSAQSDNDSGTEKDMSSNQEDTTQGNLQLSINTGSATELPTTSEELNFNLSQVTDSSTRGDDGKTSEIGLTSEPATHVDEGSEAKGNKEKTGSAESATEPQQQVLEESLYHIKWIKWKGINTPIITQNDNGPCPLLAIVNVLLLQRRISISSLQEIITSGQLMEYIGDCILEESPKRLSEGAQLNYEQNMHDAIAIMNKLQTGLDVNVKFTGVSDFEFTPECIVFDLLSIGLYHGWLVDPQNTDIASAVGSLSYNQLVEKIIASKQDAAESQLVSEGLIGEAFLEQTASQLTYHGLCELNSRLEDGQLCVFFRNNHFSTFHKHKDELFLLVTDQGFLTEDRVIWESLTNVDGDSYFVDAEFRTLPAVHSAPQPEHMPLDQQLSQEDQDYLVALSLQEEQTNAARGPQTHVYSGEPAPPQPQPSHAPTQQSAQTDQEWSSNLQLAMQLQEEERRQQQQQQQQQQQRRPQQVRASPTRSSGVPAQPTQQRSSQDSNDKCIIL